MTNAEPPPWDPGSGQPVPPGRPGSPPPFTPPPFDPPPAHQPAPTTAPPGNHPPPASPYQPTDTPESSKKRKVWPWIVGLLTLMVVGIGGCTFVWFQAATGPIDKANEFLGALADDDRPAAAAMLSTRPECFGESAAADLDSGLGNSRVTGYDLTGTSVATSNGRTTGEASGSIDIDDELGIPIRFSMIKEGDDWKVCGFQLDG